MAHQNPVEGSERLKLITNGDGRVIRALIGGKSVDNVISVALQDLGPVNNYRVSAEVCLRFTAVEIEIDDSLGVVNEQRQA